jgi:hypothetical protein
MTRFLLAGAAALATMTGVAMAQSPGQSATTQQTTTTTQAVPSPWTVSSKATLGNAVHADGDRTASAGASSVDSAGNKTNTTVTNTSYPLTGMITTTKKTTNVVNGVATETTTITNTYPPQANAAPQVTTTTRTYTVGAN